MRFKQIHLHGHIMQISNPNFQGFDFTTSFPTLFDFHCTVHWAQYDKHVTLQFDH
jgi:hypothetical protein